MKKLLLFVVAIVCSILVQAQSIDVLYDGVAFSMTSPNGLYLAGNMEDAAGYYNVSTKTIKPLEGEIQDDGGCFVWDLNDKGQLAVDWKKKAAIWSEAEGFELLPEPATLTAAERVFSAARCISNDGKYVVVSFGSPTKTVYLYTKGEDGTYSFSKLPLPEVAPIYNQIPQYVVPCGITDDGKRILFRFLVETGDFELPFVMESTPAGDWAIRWVAIDFIVEGGETDAEFYGTEFVFDGDQLEDPEGYEAAYNEWLQRKEDYFAIINAASSGYFFAGTLGDLSDLKMSANGKYAKMNISYVDFQSEDSTMYNYPAVIDLETEEVYVFTCMPEAGCLSVTNEGVVSMSTPKVEYFRYGHVSSIADPTKSQTLTEWTKERTNGVVDLAKYMTYTDTYGEKLLAEGAAIFSADGSRFMTNQYNGFDEETSRYETFLVILGSGTANDIVADNTLVVYPNPTSGVLNFSEKLSNVEVYDVVGRKVYSLSEAETSINVSGLSAGHYLLVANKEGERVSVRFVVK